MLSSLHIRNYILINSLDISFPEGLVIITGQTGAGKSILLGALSLLSGAKADASLISSESDSCVVEGEFDVNDPDLQSTMEDNDVDWDGGHLIIRRTVNRSGRSRSFINDSPVSVSLLSEISSRLIDIHSQHKSLLLTDRNFQLSVLDFFAGNSSLRTECRNLWQELRRKEAELSDLLERQRRCREEGDYNASLLQQLQDASLHSGELESLEEEQSSLSSAEQIKSALGNVTELLCPSQDDAQGIIPALKESEKLLFSIHRCFPAASGISERIESARIELSDILSEIERLDSNVDMSPEHLQMVEDRLSLLYTLLKRHSCSTVDELILLRDKLAGSVDDISNLQDSIDTLGREIDTLKREFNLRCEELHNRRVKSSPGFSEEITASLRFLELERANFVVDLNPCAPGPYGTDSVVFRFSSVGASPLELERCASGGEISRIMLCLKAMMARFVGMPTLIFDEIDTGVSGSVADKMGSMICSMGADMQVFSITHLPQVAAKGNAHYVVEKSDRNGKASSSIRAVAGEERVREIARLLSGAVVSDAAMANARVLLEND